MKPVDPESRAAAEDRGFMQHAFDLAARGRGRVAPNPIVGAVAVRDGEIIAEGWHAEFGGPHAEAALVRQCPDLSGADVYVTLEPCAHHGKTPPCSQALIDARCRRVFYSVADPNPATAGRGPQELSAAGITVESGLCEDEGRELLASYLRWTQAHVPLVTAKWAMTLDGSIATATGDSRWVSSDTMRSHTRSQRSHYDAILVGRGTVDADDPQLLGDDPTRQPLRVVLDSKLTLGVDSCLARTAQQGPVWVATCDPDEDREAALTELGVEISHLPRGEAGVDLEALLRALGERGVAHLLVEGGARVHGAFLDGGCVDRVQAILAPKLVGGEALRPILGDGIKAMADARRLEHLTCTQVGNDWVVEGALTAAGIGR